MEDAPVRSAGRHKDPAKREAILTAAKALFLDRGFAQANMQELADRAGVSKLTLYSHFGDKTALFVAAIRDHYDHHLPASLFKEWDDGDLRGSLLTFARTYHAYLLLPASISGRRLLRAPGVPAELSLEVWNAGPVRIDAFLTRSLARLGARGLLHIEDPPLAAIHLLSMIRGDLFAQLGYGVQRHVPGTETEAYLASAVDLFLRGYAGARIPPE
ncbi:TetR/AcrR family transcriptional regulator [Solilutibacter silvestris]|uniref:Transcriptional regulator n=1 Tax=Solilutibacter silvestris TaxID=1645665 RepID=A0A2K1Q0P6_9GAMM|nr:TetR/AcrR family transcriptional regulator [Lysobacter silvestris]PNS08487.1 Transcriptional regulator [Lysobacter silvestris]